jgi:hypothetical protein
MQTHYLKHLTSTMRQHALLWRKATDGYVRECHLRCAQDFRAMANRYVAGLKRLEARAA